MNNAIKTLKIAVLGAAVLALAGLPARATIVNLELYNTVSLLDQTSAPLLGNNSSGDLVQLILAGNNGVIDAPSISGGAGGDDTVLFTTHIGVGMLPVDYDNGLLDVFPISLNLTTGTNIYVRFWNGTTAALSTYYGNSYLTNWPAGDIFGYAALDFAPDAGAPHVTDQQFQALAIPEPSGVFLFGLAVCVVGQRIHRRWNTNQ